MIDLPMKSFWRQVNESALRQGDLLPNCLIPLFGPDFGEGERPADVSVAKADLIILTQSCDLENEKVSHVALCPIHTLANFEERTLSDSWENFCIAR